MNIMAAAVVLISSTLSSMLTFGTYEAFRNRGMGGWGAGAATGATLGAIGAVGMLFFGDRLKMLSAGQTSGVFAHRVSGVPSGLTITGLTMSRLSGLPVQVNGMGLEDLQLGAYGVDHNMHLMQ